jgi:hypothetical protein
VAKQREKKSSDQKNVVWQFGRDDHGRQLAKAQRQRSSENWVNWNEEWSNKEREREWEGWRTLIEGASDLVNERKKTPETISKVDWKWCDSRLIKRFIPSACAVHQMTHEWTANERDEKCGEGLLQSRKMRAESKVCIRRQFARSNGNSIKKEHDDDDGKGVEQTVAFALFRKQLSSIECEKQEKRRECDESSKVSRKGHTFNVSKVNGLAGDGIERWTKVPFVAQDAYRLLLKSQSLFVGGSDQDSARLNDADLRAQTPLSVSHKRESDRLI